MQKTASNSISKEVAGLFDRIREQAREYGRLMEELDRLTRETAEQGERVHRELEEFRSEGRTTLKRVEETTQQALSTIEHKASTLNELYTQLSTIEQTRTSLMELSSVLQTQKREIEKIIKTSENQFRRIAEESYHAFETRVALQFQQIKDDVRVLDNKLIGLLDLHRREMRQVQDDIDQFKNKVTETKYIVDETTKIVGTVIEEAEQRIDSKLMNAQLAIQHQLQSNTIVPSETSSAATVPEGAFVARRDVDQLRERVRTLEKNVGTQRTISISLAVAALILALIALVL